MAEKKSSFVISVDDIDTSLLPPEARTPGTDAFNTEVSKLLTDEYSAFGGWARIIVSDKVIEVSWREGQTDPLSQVLDHLNSGDYASGIAMLRSLLRQSPDDIDLLYNLGLALSETGEYEEAESVLNRAIEVEPTHVNSLVGLGVAQQRLKKTSEAVHTLKRAVALDESNPWAHRNLGACFLSDGNANDARTHLQKATELSPEDQQAWFGLGQASENLDDVATADDSYRQVIAIDPDTQIGELAKQQRSLIGQKEMRARVGGGLRPDGVMYCLGALEKFSKMSREEVQQCTFEIAMRGQQGFDFNDPTAKYEFRSLEGSFSGLHALAYMYVGFQYVMPGTDTGFDLSKEYEAAKAMFTGDAP